MDVRQYGRLVLAIVIGTLLIAAHSKAEPAWDSTTAAPADSSTALALGRYPVTEPEDGTSLDLPIPQHAAVATTAGQPVEVFLKCSARTNHLTTDPALTPFGS